MRPIVLFLLSVATTLLPLIVMATNTPIQSERELRDECSYEITGMKECLQKKLESSAIALKHAEDKVRHFLVKWDEDRQYIALSEAKFTASGKAFVNYRDAQCAFTASLGGSAIGNALEAGRLACMTELNNLRAKQLHNAVSDLPLR